MASYANTVWANLLRQKQAEDQMAKTEKFALEQQQMQSDQEALKHLGGIRKDKADMMDKEAEHAKEAGRVAARTGAPMPQLGSNFLDQYAKQGFNTGSIEKMDEDAKVEQQRMRAQAMLTKDAAKAETRVGEKETGAKIGRAHV